MTYLPLILLPLLLFTGHNSWAMDQRDYEDFRLRAYQRMSSQQPPADPWASQSSSSTMNSSTTNAPHHHPTPTPPPPPYGYMERWNSGTSMPQPPHPGTRPTTYPLHEDPPSQPSSSSMLPMLRRDESDRMSMTSAPTDSQPYSYHPGMPAAITKNLKAADAQRRYRSRQVKLLEITTARAEVAERSLTILQEELAVIHSKLDEILAAVSSQKKRDSFTE